MKPLEQPTLRKKFIYHWFFWVPGIEQQFYDPREVAFAKVYTRSRWKEPVDYTHGQKKQRVRDLQVQLAMAIEDLD